MTGREFLERLQLVAATATLTSAVWIVVGTVYLDEPVASPDASPAQGAEAEPRVEEAADGTLAIPVLGADRADLVDSFAQARDGRKHEAIDIMAEAGTPVIAADAGTVEKLFVSDAGGNTVYVRSRDRRTIHYYAHLQSYQRGLAEGQRVARGQPLGSVGSTGNADPSAPHLHFAILRTRPEAEWWEPGIATNPFTLLKP